MADGLDPPDRWSRVWKIFDGALQLDDPERAAFLAEACGSDKEILQEVERYLAAHRVPSPLDRSPVAQARPNEATSLPTEVFETTQPDLARGVLLAGRFEIGRRLGHGGMGAVYEARDLELDATVAIKTLRPEIAGSSEAQERFRREIQVAKQVTHPNVCRIHDLFRHDDDLVFLSMEFLQGETLAERLAESGPLDPSEALPIVEQITDGLEAAHRSDVVHRDLKSSNVMLVPDDSGERAVVTDFGLARITNQDGRSPGDAQARHLTHTGQVLGTPAFMAPEQLEGGEITPATDVYALGVVLFEMVTARLPFEGETPFSVVAHRLQSEAPSPRSFAPDLDRHWERVILRCLERDPENRYQRARDVSAALKGEAVHKPWARRQRRRWVAGLAASALLATLAWLTIPPPLRDDPPVAATELAFEARDWVLIVAFENRTGDDVLDGTLESALRRELSSSRHVNVVPHERIADSLRLMKQPEDSRLDPELAREVSLRDGDIPAMITGRVERLGSTYVLNAELVAVHDSSIIETFSADAPGQDDLLVAVRRLSSSVREALGEALSRIQADEEALAQVTTPSLRALKLYSQAEQGARSYISAQNAEALLREAVTEDPEFATAYIQLARMIATQGRPPEEYLPITDHAVELAASVSDWERQLIRGYAAALRGNWEEAISSWEAVQLLRPDLLLSGSLMATHAFELAQFEEAAPHAVAWASAQPHNLFANMQATRALAIWRASPSEAEPYFQRAAELMAEQKEDLQEVSILGAMALDFLLLYPYHQLWVDGDLEGALAEVEQVHAELSTYRGELNGWLVRSVSSAYLTLGKIDAAQETQPAGADLRWMASARGDRAHEKALLLEAVGQAGRLNATTVTLLLRHGLLADARLAVDELVARSESSYSYPGERRPTPASAAVAQGTLALAEGRHDVGITLLRSGVRQLKASGLSDYFVGASSLADALLQGGQSEAAVRILEEASEQKGRVYPWQKHYWFETRLQLADLYRQQDRIAEAGEIEEELLGLMLYADPDFWLVTELAARRERGTGAATG